MEASGSVPSKSDVRVIICFLCLEGVGRNEINLCLFNVFGECNIISKHAAYQWIEKFKMGRSNAEDEPYSNQLKDMLSEDSIACVHNLLQDHCF